MSKNKAKPGRWHASQESDELIFAACDRYFQQLGKAAHAAEGDERTRGAAAAVAEWIQAEYGRPDITREKIYPLFWEASQRGFLLLQAPWEQTLKQNLEKRYHLESHPGEITVADVNGAASAQHVTSTAADIILKLIDKVWTAKKKKHPNDIDSQAVHLGLGAGIAAMLVAKRLAQKVRSGEDVPPLVLHAISAGGFLPQEPQKSPTAYFSFFDSTMMNIKYVALFSETVVDNAEYEKVKNNPGVRLSFDLKDQIDIIVTSLAAADHEHGLLVQYLNHLADLGYLEADTLETMHNAGWIGDVQFRPYSAEGPLNDACPVRAVTLFELEELVEIAKGKSGKYVVLVAGPCGECGETKKKALKPLVANEKLRLWTHLVLDARTAKELLED